MLSLLGDTWLMDLNGFSHIDYQFGSPLFLQSVPESSEITHSFILGLTLVGSGDTFTLVMSYNGT